MQYNADKEAWEAGHESHGGLDEVLGVVHLRNNVANESVGEVERKGNVS